MNYFLIRYCFLFFILFRYADEEFFYFNINFSDLVLMSFSLYFIIDFCKDYYMPNIIKNLKVASCLKDFYLWGSCLLFYISCILVIMGSDSYRYRDIYIDIDDIYYNGIDEDKGILFLFFCLFPIVIYYIYIIYQNKRQALK